MKKTIIALLLILAFTVAGIGMVTPVETNACCLTCCAGCVVMYWACLDLCLGDKETCEGLCGMALRGCQQDCPCCNGCP